MTIETVQSQKKRPFWRKLARGFGFMLIGLAILAFWAWLLGGVGVAIGFVAMIGLFVEGYRGRALSEIGASSTSAMVAANGPSLAATAAAPTSVPRRRGLWWKVPLGFVAAFSAVVVIAAIVGPPSNPTDSDTAVEKQAASQPIAKPVAPPPKKPETLEDRVGAGSIERAGDWVIIRHKPGTVWSSKSYVIDAGQLLERVGRWAAPDVSGRIGAKKIILQVWPTTTDRYGKEDRTMVLALEINPTEFTKINWSNFSATDMLNLVEIAQLWPAMVPGVVEYCKDRGDAARHFCAQASRFIR